MILQMGRRIPKNESEWESSFTLYPVFAVTVQIIGCTSHFPLTCLGYFLANSVLTLSAPNG